MGIQAIKFKSSGEPSAEHTAPDRGPSSPQGGGGFSYETFHHPDQIELFAPAQLLLALPSPQISAPVQLTGPALCASWRAEWLLLRDEAMRNARRWSDHKSVWVEQARRANRCAISRGRWARGLA